MIFTKIKIVENKYLNALFLLMLLSAIIHMAVLFCFAILSHNAYSLNYFNILDLDLLYPNLFNGIAGNIFSIIFVIFLYFIILAVNKTE